MRPAASRPTPVPAAQPRPAPSTPAAAPSGTEPEDKGGAPPYREAMPWEGWVALGALVVAVVALVLVLDLRRRSAGAVGPVTEEGAEGPAGVVADRVAFVANPSKPGYAETREAAVRACAERYLPEPLWFETTEDDPGRGQAEEALAAGAALVVAVGGDGTVRSVATALAGSGVTMAVLPQGTGNLLALNLDIPSDRTAALRVALGQRERVIDVGRLTEARPDGSEGREHVFLIAAGVGFDASMVADADSDLKARVGWIAYFVAGLKHLGGRRLPVTARTDEGPWEQFRLRSFLVGNCGRLPAGLNLLPDAVIDDGLHDVAVLDATAGIVGWTQLLVNVLLQSVGIRARAQRVGSIQHRRARTVEVRLRAPRPLQVDGDIVGPAAGFTTRVDAGALVVRVP